MSADWEFQKGLYDALAGNAPLMAAANAIYDTAPQAADGGSAAAFPYVTIGMVVATEDDTGSKVGFSMLARIHTWSRSGSMKECKTIQGLVFDALHKQSLTVTGYLNYSILRETSDIVRDDDAVFHGVCEYRALLEVA